MKNSIERRRARVSARKLKSTPEAGPSRLSTLKLKLENLQRLAAAAFLNGDQKTKDSLELEAAQLSAAISRAEVLMAGHVR